jgi:predicted membrane protein
VPLPCTSFYFILFSLFLSFFALILCFTCLLYFLSFVHGWQQALVFWGCACCYLYLLSSHTKVCLFLFDLIFVFVKRGRKKKKIIQGGGRRIKNEEKRIEKEKKKNQMRKKMTRFFLYFLF